MRLSIFSFHKNTLFFALIGKLDYKLRRLLNLGHFSHLELSLLSGSQNLHLLFFGHLLEFSASLRNKESRQTLSISVDGHRLAYSRVFRFFGVLLGLVLKSEHLRTHQTLICAILWRSLLLCWTHKTGIIRQEGCLLVSLCCRLFTPIDLILNPFQFDSTPRSLVFGRTSRSRDPLILLQWWFLRGTYRWASWRRLRAKILLVSASSRHSTSSSTFVTISAFFFFAWSLICAIVIRGWEFVHDSFWNPKSALSLRFRGTHK